MALLQRGNISLVWVPNTSPSLPVTQIEDFLPVFLITDCSVPFPPTDDWFKRPGALQRPCMTSEGTLSLKPQHSVCLCVRARACVTNRQTSCANKSVDCVCTEMWHTVRESCSSNNVLLGTGTISALCGRTVALLLKSQASSNSLFYWQTIQQHWHTIWWSKCDFYSTM